MVIPDRFIVLYRTQYYKLHMSVRFRLSVSRLFDRVSVSVDLVSVCDRVEILYYKGTWEHCKIPTCTVATKGVKKDSTRSA